MDKGLIDLLATLGETSIIVVVILYLVHLYNKRDDKSRKEHKEERKEWIAVVKSFEETNEEVAKALTELRIVIASKLKEQI